MDTYSFLFPVLAALCAGVLILYVSERLLLRVSANSAAAYANGGPAPTLVEQVGAALLRVLRVDLSAWELRLRWVNLTAPKRQSLAGIVGLSLLLGGVSLAGALFARVPLLWLLPFVALALPFLRLRGQATAVQREVKRALPEVAALIAAEMAAGQPAEVALERAAALPGPLALIAQAALGDSQRLGRPLFSRPPMRGVFIETTQAWGLPALSTFARQVDLAAAKGVNGAEQMNRVAQGLTREYRGDLNKRAANLETQLTVATALFIFLPTLIAVGATLLVPLASSF